MMTGQNLFISDYTYKGEPGTSGTVCLGTDFPSKILRLNVDEYGGKIICQKGALLCASHTIDIEMEFAKKMTTGVSAIEIVSSLFLTTLTNHEHTNSYCPCTSSSLVVKDLFFKGSQERVMCS
jgi:uncharacterized protein (AIM24 family)